jgi:hypothetical protein
VVTAERARGEPVADPDDCDAQRPPAPSARGATAANRTAQALGPQWRRTAARLGVAAASEVTVIPDGARWICREAEENLPGAAGVLDVFHASGQLHAAAVARHGEGAEAVAWLAARRRTPLRRGAAGVLAGLAAEPGPDAGLAEYLGPHVDHTAHRQRLAAGRSIGSGPVEGRARRRSGGG